MSLNNRISIRDSYSARGGVVDCPEAMISETEEPQVHLPSMTQPVVAEADVGERVKQSESCDVTIYSGLE